MKAHPFINEVRDGKIICVKCEVWQEPEVFSAAPRMKRGRHSWCRSCQTANMSVWLTPERRQRRNEQKRSTYNPEQAKANRAARYADISRSERKSKLARKYGITLADYDRMAEQQEYLCLICLLEKELHVDHCHATGAVRGLLCRSCNVALGHLEDDPARMARALAYLGQRLKDSMVG